MRRGTTPTITVKVNADLTDMGIHLAFRVGDCRPIVKLNDDMEITVEELDGEPVTTIVTRLTQEDTLSMRDGNKCEVQIRAIQDNGETAFATTIGTIPVKRILEEGVLRE